MRAGGRGVRAGAATAWVFLAAAVPSYWGVAGDSSRVGSGGQAARPVVFDVPAVVPARLLDGAADASTVPGTRRIAFDLPVSTMVLRSERIGAFEVWWRLLPVAPAGYVADYAPKTSLITEYAGPVQIDDQRESSSRLGLNLSGGVYAGNGEAIGDVAAKKKNARRITRLPPKSLAVAAGTLNRGRGLFFKFRPSSQTTLEGRRVLHVVVEVDADWRGNVWRVDAAARRQSDGESVGHASFLVALYRADLPEARRDAESFVASAAQFRRSWLAASAPRSHRSWWHRMWVSVSRSSADSRPVPVELPAPAVAARLLRRAASPTQTDAAAPIPRDLLAGARLRAKSQALVRTYHVLRGEGAVLRSPPETKDGSQPSTSSYVDGTGKTLAPGKGKQARGTMPNTNTDGNATGER